MRKIFIISFLIILSVILVACGGNDKATGNTIANTGDYVTIALSDISEQINFYSFEDNGVDINYFAVLGSDGEPRVAFDACDVCGGSKGYKQTGTDITCRNCGKVFRIDDLGTKNKGYGCWPSYLPHKVQGNNILININDLKSGKHRFA